MFLIASALFTLFTLLYGLLSLAIVYHLKHYTLPGQRIPKLITAIYGFLSVLFWLFALYFLLKIQR